MVQPDVVGVHLFPGEAQEGRDAPLHGDRSVADAHGAYGRVLVQRLHHDSDGVREVHQQRLGRHVLDKARVVEHRRDRPQRHREAPGPGGLLADDPVPQRDLLVDGPGALLARADRREDEPRAVDRLPRLGLAADRESCPPVGAQVSAHGGHELQALGVGVVQHDLVQPERRPARRTGRAGRRAPARPSPATSSSRRPSSRDPLRPGEPDPA